MKEKRQPSRAQLPLRHFNFEMMPKRAIFRQRTFCDSLKSRKVMQKILTS